MGFFFFFSLFLFPPTGSLRFAKDQPTRRFHHLSLFFFSKKLTLRFFLSRKTASQDWLVFYSADYIHLFLMSVPRIEMLFGFFLHFPPNLLQISTLR